MAALGTTLIDSLRQVLLQLHQSPYPNLPNPEGCKKRASVALVIRVRPSYADSKDLVQTARQGNTEDGGPQSLTDFFAQSWVQSGDPEVLFIKRAGRAGDRWSGHTALPGGRRDPPDADDLAAAVRETKEEVGLDLTSSSCLRAGNLPQRVVTTAWSKEALMILCPFIFVLTGKTTAPLSPQPTEVAAAHWVPLRGLLSPCLRTCEYTDVSSRLARQQGPLSRSVLRFLLGKMEFSAVKLIPSESLYASSIPGFIPEGGSGGAGVFSRLARGAFGLSSSSSAHGQALLLWGLTLGVLADLLDKLPPHNALKLWQFPTFTPLDLRAIIYLMTFSLHRNNARDLSAGTWPSQTAADATTTAMAVPEAAEPTRVSASDTTLVPAPSHAVGKMLNGYYQRMSTAIAFFLAYRALVGSAAIFWLVRRWRSRHY